LRGTGLALLAAFFALALQWPFFKGVMLIPDATPGVRVLAERYFFIRIWAAPATMTLMTLRGWFVGMQDSVHPMWMDLIINAVNIGASILLAFGVGPWPGLGFAGIPLGTVIAQYCGLLYGLLVCRFRYGKRVFAWLQRSDLSGLLRDGSMGRFFRMNLDLLGRSFFFILIYIGFTMIAAGYGDVMLAASSILMQLLMFFSYFTDGFAYAGEALTGRFIGAKDGAMLRLSVRYVFAWSLVLALFFAGLYAVAGSPVIRLLTSDETVVEACRQFLPWLLLMPPLGCAAFTWDGIFLGATASRGLMSSMAGAAVSFFCVWYAGKGLLHPTGAAALHLLFAAYYAHLAFRTVWLTLRYKKEVLGKV
ncbi:MAG: MATE family efflux transporter, partial [Oscillospiraceae bacterium]|nr:MATE family efflux transporter [Oscillospiraceae bacterium]